MGWGGLLLSLSPPHSLKKSVCYYYTNACGAVGRSSRGWKRKKKKKQVSSGGGAAERAIRPSKKNQTRGSQTSPTIF
jgi:hypothetical protein